MNGCGLFFMVVSSMPVMENLKHYTTTSLLLPLNLRTIALRAPLEVRESRNPCFTESDRLEMLGDTVYLNREGKGQNLNGIGGTSDIHSWKGILLHMYQSSFEPAARC